MPKVTLNCLYCDKVFEEFVYTQEQVKNTRCPVCNDRNLKILDDGGRHDIYGYQYDTPREDE